MCSLLLLSRNADQEWKGCDPIHWFNPATFLHLSQNHDLDILRSYFMVFFMFTDMRSEVDVCFVNIGGIIDHKCSNFLFVIDH